MEGLSEFRYLNNWHSQLAPFGPTWWKPMIIDYDFDMRLLEITGYG